MIFKWKIQQTLRRATRSFQRGQREYIWLIKQRDSIKAYMRNYSVRKLQLGSGKNILQDWLNTDMEPKNDKIIYLDTTKLFPIKTNSFDYIFSEHQFEHLTFKDGAFMLSECFRILKPGGKIRIATPDFDVLAGLLTQQKTKIQDEYINFLIDHFLPEAKQYDAIFAINIIFSNMSHRFIYNKKTLKGHLHEAGFQEATTAIPGESNDKHLANLESHGKLLKQAGFVNGEELNSFETMVMEAIKPLSSTDNA